MTTYNTRAPIGSGAAKDFFDNAQNLDFFANSQSLQNYPDRLGTSRLTLYGMNVKFSVQMVQQALAFNTQLSDQQRTFTAWYHTAQSEITNLVKATEDRLDRVLASKDDVPLGDYSQGPFTIMAPNQTITHNGNSYRVKSSTVLPYTTNGNSDASWVIDAGYLRLLSDAELRAQLAAADGTTLIGMPVGRLSDLLSDCVYVEQFRATGETSWEGAVQRAIDYAIRNNIPEVRGGQVYNFKSPIYIRGAGGKGFKLKLNGITADASWPVNTSLWDATPLIVIGDANGNMTNLEIEINVMDGGGVADGIINYYYGYALSILNIGYIQNCVRGIVTGDQRWPNASMQLYGKYWINNWLAVYITNGGSGTEGPPIVEGWKIHVLFTAANRLPGVWIRRSGQYIQISGDYDFNGRWITQVVPSAYTGLEDIKDGQRLRGRVGTRSAEFLTYYTMQQTTYLVFFEDMNVAADSGNTQFCKAGDVITIDGYPNSTITVGSTTRCSDNASGTNYYDILHDFENTPFAKCDISCGYLSGVIGGMQFTSNINYFNSFSAVTNSIQGFSVGNDGTNMTLYDQATGGGPFMIINPELMAINRRLQMGDHKVTGVTTYQILPASDANTKYDVMTLNDTTTDKYGQEGSLWRITIVCNFQNVMGTIDYGIWGVAGLAVYDRILPGAIFEWDIIEVTDDAGNLTGANLRLRQGVQTTMQFSITKTRIG